MKNSIKLFGIIALAAVIGFAFITCDDGNNNNNGGTEETGGAVKTLTGITAEYEPTTEIFPDTEHDTLKEGLTVKAQYSDSTDKTLNDADYSLIGDFTVGESVITVSYTEGGVTKTATFKVTVDALTHAHNWQFKSTTATCTEAGEELWECDAIDPAHHEDRPVAALGHIWKWEIDNPSANIDTQVCSRCSQEGETRHVFTTAAAITTFLSSQEANTPDTPYNIKLNVDTLPWTTNGAAQTAFGGKYVNLDLSDSTLTSFNANAFYNCTLLTGITIPASVETIADGGDYSSGTFRGCTNLTSVTFAEDSQLTAIGNYAFYNCSSLTDITIPENVTSIGNYAFYNCSSLTGITIPNSVTTISNYAFYGCSGLTGITIPEGVTSIGSYAFQNCSGFTGITIPNSVTSIGNSAFRGCTSLASITIPNSVTSIGSSAFYQCTGLTSVTISEGVTSINNSAFSGCTGLTGMTIPASVTSIDTQAFQGCTGLTSVTIPASVTSIGSNAFNGCTGLTSVTIPASVTFIGDSAFSGCTGLVSVTFEGTIASTGWITANSFPGDLRTKYFATGGAGGIGTYTRSGSGTTEDPYVWTKQS